MPATAYDIVVGALQRCKVYAIGEPPTAAVGQIGLRTLNMMRAQMSAEGVACFGLQELTTSADGASSYTVGTGGDIAGRILGVRSVSILDGDAVTAPDEVTLDEFRLLAAAESGSPIYWAQKQGEPYSVYLWPAPTSGTVRIIARTTFANIAHLSDLIPEPDEYLEMFECMLAVRMADKFGSDPGPSTVATAERAYAALRARANSGPPPLLHIDEMLTGTAYIDHDTEER